MAEKQQYAQQPMVVVGAPAQVQSNYTIPKAKIPGIMMLVVAFFNGIAFLVLGVMSGNFGGLIEFVVSFLLYGLVGMLAVLAAFREQRGQACVVAMIVFAVFALILSFVQIIIRGLASAGGAILMTSNDQRVELLGTVILIISAVTLFFAILVFVLTIVLIVFGSQVVCQCCGAPTQAQGGVVYQAAPLQQA